MQKRLYWPRLNIVTTLTRHEKLLSVSLGNTFSSKTATTKKTGCNFGISRQSFSTIRISQDIHNWHWRVQSRDISQLDIDYFVTHVFCNMNNILCSLPMGNCLLVE